MEEFASKNYWKP